MILGLDISTSITGYTVLDYDGNILVCDHIDLRKEKDFFNPYTDMLRELIYIEKHLNNLKEKLKENSDKELIK